MRYGSAEINPIAKTLICLPLRYVNNAVLSSWIGNKRAIHSAKRNNHKAKPQSMQKPNHIKQSTEAPCTNINDYRT